MRLETQLRCRRLVEAAFLGVVATFTALLALVLCLAGLDHVLHAERWFLPRNLLALLIWAGAAVPGTAVACWWWRFSGREARCQSGLCPSCGYDLRATPGRCP